MTHNPNPFTPLQERILQAIRKKLVEIRNPDKEVLDNCSYEFYIEHTKKFGALVKIRFRPNSLAIKEAIMRDVGYIPVAEKHGHIAARNAAASAFDKHWDNLMFRLIKSGKMLARLNLMFTEDGQAVSELITLVQHCIEPDKVDGKLHTLTKPKVQHQRSYMEELAEVQ